MSPALSQQEAMDGAVRHLVSNYSPKGSRVGWLMMASILVEAWDLYSIAFVLIFIREQYHPDPLLLGLAAAGTQGGALIGRCSAAGSRTRSDGASCSSRRW
jgi:hypothetical protein